MIQIARPEKIGQKFKILSCNQILQIIPLYIVKNIFWLHQEYADNQLFI